MLLLRTEACSGEFRPGPAFLSRKIEGGGGGGCNFFSILVTQTDFSIYLIAIYYRKC